MKKLIRLSCLILAVIFLSGCSQKPADRTTPALPETTGEQTSSAELAGETLSGILVKNDREKSSLSYCAQGSDYFTLKTSGEELILKFEPAYSEEQMSALAGKNVVITGEKEVREIRCPSGQRCPLPPEGVFTCEVFRVETISE